jgi:hypothetical protein
MPLPLSSSTFHLTTPQKIEQIRQMCLDDSLIMNEAFADEHSRDSSSVTNELVWYSFPLLLILKINSRDISIFCPSDYRVGQALSWGNIRNF